MLVTQSVRRSTLVTLLVIGAAACGDVSTAPSGLSPDSGPLTSSGTSGRGQGSGTRTFVIWPGASVDERFGDHTLKMPANVICDPASSGYGPAFWDAPCALIEKPIEITATWTSVNDTPVISFVPDLRFVPSTDQSRWVNLSMKDTKGIDPDRYYAILWYDAADRRWVDESLTDATLKARTSQSGNMVTRRLKHFSDYLLDSSLGSYNVTSGFLGGETDGGSW